MKNATFKLKEGFEPGRRPRRLAKSCKISAALQSAIDLREQTGATAALQTPLTGLPAKPTMT